VETIASGDKARGHGSVPIQTTVHRALKSGVVVLVYKERGSHGREEGPLCAERALAPECQRSATCSLGLSGPAILI